MKAERELALLVLEDGKTFVGKGVGYCALDATKKCLETGVLSDGLAHGEVVFNTSLSGYQEILTDPSYVGQVMTFTYPHIGNVGVNKDDVESSKVQVSGLVVKKLCEHYSNYRAEDSLENYLIENRVSGISEIDTRELVIHLRGKGSQRGLIAHFESPPDSGVVKKLIDIVKTIPSMEGRNLVDKVTCSEPYDWFQGSWSFNKFQGEQGYYSVSAEQVKDRPKLAVIDFGVKYNILRLMIDAGFSVRVFPAAVSKEELISYGPQAVFLSNGPGDPASVTEGIKLARELVGKYPLFGICLGHQILGHALGAKTYKLPFGHRGGNHPVRDEKTGKVEITVQNHGFATSLESIPTDVRVSHINLNDKTVEGFSIPESRAFSIQYHPEASPGPLDSGYLFREFYEMVMESSDAQG